MTVQAAPARILGLKAKGHLGPGADGDVTIYTPGPDKKAMFELPRYVIKGGEVVVEQGEVRQDLSGKTLHVAPEYDEGWCPTSRSGSSRTTPSSSRTTPWTPATCRAGG
jgi:formylmethanofuran dehydrogenase subunit A